MKRHKYKPHHVNAQCFGCDWNCGDYRTAITNARRHNLKTGHKVSCEVAYIIEYEWSGPKEGQGLDIVTGH